MSGLFVWNVGIFIHKNWSYRVSGALVHLQFREHSITGILTADYKAAAIVGGPFQLSSSTGAMPMCFLPVVSLKAQVT